VLKPGYRNGIPEVPFGFVPEMILAAKFQIQRPGGVMESRVMFDKSLFRNFLKSNSTYSRTCARKILIYKLTIQPDRLE